MLIFHLMNMHRFYNLQNDFGKHSPLTEISTVNMLCETMIKTHSFIYFLEVEPKWVDL